MSKSLTIEKCDLVELLNGASKFFGKNNKNMEILDFYKLDVVTNAVKVTVFNNDASIECVAPVMAFEKFSACVHKDLLEIVKKCPNGEITLELNDLYMSVKAGNAVFTVGTQDVMQYPRLPETKEGAAINISVAELDELCQSVEYAMGKEDSAQKLIGTVNFKVKDKKLFLTALDGKRVATKEMEVDTDLEVDINIPPIAKYLKSMDSRSDVSISWDENFIIIKEQFCKIVCRLIDGKYFDTHNFFAIERNTEMTVKKEDLVQSLERAALVAKGNGNKTPVIMEVMNEILLMEVQEAKNNSFRETITIHKTGKDIRTGFNVQLLLDALTKVAADSVKLIFANARGPLLVKATEDEKDNFTHLVLPVTIPKRTH